MSCETSSLEVLSKIPPHKDSKPDAVLMGSAWEMTFHLNTNKHPLVYRKAIFV